MRFAARLGIGRYVPCFVFFTDVGQLSVDVFPVGQLSADETYEQLRAWIDSFYEKNYVSVDKWKQVEKDITAFTNSINQPVTKLKNWISKGEELWDELRSVAQVIVKLSRSISKPEAYKSVIDELNSSSWRCSRILSECRTRLENLDTKREKHKLHQKRLESIINNLNAASDSAKVYDELSRAVGEPLTSPALSILRKAINLMEQYRRQQIIPSLETQLFTWWRLLQDSLPSLNKFKGTRRQWTFVTDKSDMAAESEYLAFLTAIFALPVSYRSEVMVEKAQVLLANIIGIDSCSTDWNEAFSAYCGRRLMPFFHQLCDSTPEWITKDDPELKISDIIPFK